MTATAPRTVPPTATEGASGECDGARLAALHERGERLDARVRSDAVVHLPRGASDAVATHDADMHDVISACAVSSSRHYTHPARLCVKNRTRESTSACSCRPASSRFHTSNRSLRRSATSVRYTETAT
jgi:hypothetical protein